jgi:Plant transposon protein
MCILEDGIYPKYSCFVCVFKEAITEEEISYTDWQEGSQKDIQKAFGELQCKGKVIAFPIQDINLKDIRNMVSTCLILPLMGCEQTVNCIY